LVSIWCFAIPAWSQANPDELARRHFESGAAYFEQAEYDSALREFRKSFELSSRPEILINIATVHERLADLHSAIEALDQFLQLKGDSEQTATIRLRRDNLQKRLDEQSKPQAVEPQQPAMPPPAAPAQPDEPRGPNRVPAYVMFSVAGVSAAGAVLTGVFANAEFQDLKDRCAPNCSDNDVSGARTLGTVSTVLTGAAIVSAGIGVVFWLSADDNPPKRGFNARLQVTHGGAVARAGWAF
jgi:hypothetical protein